MDLLEDYISDFEDMCPSPDAACAGDFHHEHDAAYEHIVQFYDTQEYLLSALTSFIVPILSCRDAAVVIATKQHLEALEVQLCDRGVTVAEKKKRGQLCMIDANEMLDRLTVRGNKSPFCIEPLNSLICQLDNKFAKIYVYGELVNLLCAQGDHASAIRLEEMWNSLQKQFKFTLLCGYDMGNFKEERLQHAFSDICHTHSRVHPTKDCSAFRSENDQGSSPVSRARQTD
jgi:hypothetical protein